MANLNIPFLIPQGNKFGFDIDRTNSRIKDSSKGACVINQSGGGAAGSDMQIPEIQKNMLVLAEN